MSREVAAVIVEKFGLDKESERLLIKNIKNLDRMERRFYFRDIKPMEKKFKEYLSGYYAAGSDALKDKIVRDTVNSLLERRGDPDLVDSMVMDVVGRLKIYKILRERSESEGIKLSALTNFGGLSMVLFAVVIIAAIVLYIRNM
ncbi:MAG: hypothetical protein K6T65_07625 [Peptococcaceae bacterium]|nr:hypothetical protein [Peptococcaceae bacterium]